jgi:hypothetical protein
VKQRAAKGEAEAQYSQAFLLVEGDVSLLGTSGRSPMADVGLKLCNAQFPVAPESRKSAKARNGRGTYD